MLVDQLPVCLRVAAPPTFSHPEGYPCSNPRLGSKVDVGVSHVVCPRTESCDLFSPFTHPFCKFLRYASYSGMEVFRSEVWKRRDPFLKQRYNPSS